MEKINDIEAIIPSQIEHYIFIIYFILAILVVLGVLLFWGYWKKRKKKPPHPFDSLDLTKANKELLYNFTLIAKSIPAKEGLEELLEMLEPYKYKKESSPIDPKIIEAISEYIKRCKQ